MISALFVEKDGVYFNQPNIDPWDVDRDARNYNGYNPIIAHPPCQRWGRFWHGSTAKPHQYKMGDDDGCFESAFNNLIRYGGVLEHPADSHAWDKDFYNITKPKRNGGWVYAGKNDLYTCCVYQGKYGHFSGKPTWLLTSKIKPEHLPELKWGKTEQRIHPTALAKHGYEKARRIGMVAMIGGKDKTKIRNATPIEFRDLLIEIASLVNPC